MSNDSNVTKYIEQEFSISLPNGTTEVWKKILSERIYELMLHDRNTLIAILYRVDVSESNLTMLLYEADKRKAADAIAELVINRQLQKIKFRNAFPENSADIDENEKW